VAPENWARLFHALQFADAQDSPGLEQLMTGLLIWHLQTKRMHHDPTDLASQQRRRAITGKIGAGETASDHATQGNTA
jgi:hypothetical protein